MHGTGQGLLALAGFCNFNVKTFLKENLIMKKVLSFVLAGAMVLSLAACGDPGSTSGQAPGSAGSSTQVTEVTG